MAKLHEILAVEKNLSNQVNVLMQETLQKFNKDHFFRGWVKSLKMIKDSPDNTAVEQAAAELREVPTTVRDTLEYVLDLWAKAEDVQYCKNRANQNAIGQLQIGPVTLALPVDELMGLENRLVKIREVFQAIPTLDATRTWIPSTLKSDTWQTAQDDVTTKTEKVTIPVVLYEATKDHPAQVEKVSRDEVVGAYTSQLFSGAVPTLKKALALHRIDNLITEVKKARMRANCVEVPEEKIGAVISKFLLEPLI
jgi:hypothetical protein